MTRRGVFPGSFNPLTVAHLEIARLARHTHRLDEVHFVVSEVALDKPDPPGPPLLERIALIGADLAAHPEFSVRVTSLTLIADIAAGYDVVIMGADKWEQVNDVRYYESVSARDAAIAQLPETVVAPRTGIADPRDPLLTPPELRSVSSTAAREGARHLMAPHAAAGWRDPIVVRLAELHESDIAATIYLESRQSAIPAIPASIHPDHEVRQWFREQFAPSHEIWFAVVRGLPVGVLALGEGWVEQLYVLSDHTNSGVGSRLLHAAMDRQDSLDLWTFEANVDARRFYERHGFVEVDRTDGDNEEGAPDVRYRWTR
ncbi:MAG: GNAT family N-acetyltransferase [Acidimicrobiales bacterium]